MHCVYLGESFQTHIYLQNSASIQPRTSLVKFGAGRLRRPNALSFVTAFCTPLFSLDPIEWSDGLEVASRAAGLRPRAAACAKKGASGRMQRPAELVPIRDAACRLRESSVKALRKVREG